MGARGDPGRARCRGVKDDGAGRPELVTWEVFRQEKEGDPMRHGGSVMAPDADLATH